MCRSRSVFFEMNGWDGEKRVVPCAHPLTQGSVPPWMGVSHFVLCNNGCQKTGGSNGIEKDMFRLEAMVQVWLVWTIYQVAVPHIEGAL